MPMPMRGNRRGDNQTNKDLEGIQTSSSEVSPGRDTAKTARSGQSSGDGCKQASERCSEGKTGLLRIDTPLSGSDQDRGTYKITYRWSYKIGGWRRMR